MKRPFDVEKTKELIGKITTELCDTITDYEVIDRGCPHVPHALPTGYAAVYIFEYKGEVLKIGKANMKSNMRFQYQHYGLNAMSTLAKSLLNDTTMAEEGLTLNNIAEWIKANTRRVDILIDAKYGKKATELVEAILHYYYEPRYEGAI